MKEMATRFMRWNMEEEEGVEEGGEGGERGEGGEDIIKFSGNLLCLFTILELGACKTYAGLLTLCHSWQMLIT